MITFLIYEAKVAVLLAVFYIFYRLMLSKETLHRLNRAVLLGTVAMSLILPLCVITIHKFTPAVMGPGPSDIGDLWDFPAVEVVTVSSTTWWQIVIIAAYLTGVAVIIAKVVASIAGVARIIRNSELETASDGTPVNVTSIQTSPFSWMSHIVMSRGDFESGNICLVRHEKAHIALRHSNDVMFVDLISALQWFNPVVWMLRADLRAVHEFEADDAVLRSGADIKEYQYLLIRKAVCASGYSIANSFNHSYLKSRISMMSKSGSAVISGLKALYVLPIVCLVLASNVHIVYAQSKDTAALTVIGVQNENVRNEKNDGSRFFMEEEVVCVRYAGNPFETVVGKYNAVAMPGKVATKDEVTEPAVFGAEDGNFSRWLAQMLPYPAESRHQGKVVVQFVVDKKGRVCDVTVNEGVDDIIDKAVVDVISSSPSWTPAKKNGKAVASLHVQPISFVSRYSAPKSNPVSLNPIKMRGGENIVYILDGKEISKDEFNSLKPSGISAISIIKGDDASKYTDKACEGVILIYSKDDEQ